MHFWNASPLPAQPDIDPLVSPDTGTSDIQDFGKAAALFFNPFIFRNSRNWIGWKGL